jgi:hypothetical protein
MMSSFSHVRLSSIEAAYHLVEYAMAFERTHPRESRADDPTRRPLPSQLAGYRLTEAEARPLHAMAHDDGCWCTNLRGDQFVRELYLRCLEPAGFVVASPDSGPGILIADGPGIRDQRSGELYDTIRNCGGWSGGGGWLES